MAGGFWLPVKHIYCSVLTTNTVGNCLKVNIQQWLILDRGPSSNISSALSSTDIEMQGRTAVTSLLVCQLRRRPSLQTWKSGRLVRRRKARQHGLRLSHRTAARPTGSSSISYHPAQVASRIRCGHTGEEEGENEGDAWVKAQHDNTTHTHNSRAVTQVINLSF